MAKITQEQLNTARAAKSPRETAKMANEAGID